MSRFKRDSKTLGRVKTTIQDLFDDGLISTTAMKKLANAGLDELQTSTCWPPPGAEMAEVYPGEVGTFEQRCLDSYEAAVDNECPPPPSPPLVGSDPYRPPTPPTEETPEASILTPEASMDERLLDNAAVGKEKTEDAGVIETAGWGFLWCYECGRMDIIIYACKQVQWCSDEDGVEGASTAIGIISCGTCKAGYQDPVEVDRRNKESFEYLRMKPAQWAGLEAEKIAETIAGKQVEFLTDKHGGMKYFDVDKIMEELTFEDEGASVDVAGFREGKRVELVLKRLRGGLTMRRKRG